jgi:hypothetical protein
MSEAARDWHFSQGGDEAMRYGKTVWAAILTPLLVALGVIAGFGPAQAEDNPFKREPPFKTAVIEYTMAGSEQGKATLYVEKLKQAKVSESSVSMMGRTGEVEKKAHITTPEQVIDVNISKKTARAHGNMQTYLAQEYEKLSPAEKVTVRKNAEKLGATMMTQFAGGVPKAEQGVFLGKPVDIVTFKGITTQTWKDAGIPLKSEGSMMGMKISNVATSLKTDVPLPAGVFEAPAGIEVVFDQQADQMMRMMAGRMLTSLKDPNFEENMKNQGGAGAMMGIPPGMGKPGGKPGAMPKGNMPPADGDD